MFSLQRREEEETGDLHAQGLIFSTSVYNPECYSSPFMHTFLLQPPSFPLYRANHLPHAYAPYDPTRQNGSIMPIRLARLKSSALEPEVEIHGTAATPRAAWTQTAMERYVQAFHIRNSDITCKCFWCTHLKYEIFIIVKHSFYVIRCQADEQAEQSEASSDGEAQWQSESSSR